MGVFGSLLAASGLSKAMAAQSRMAVLTVGLTVGLTADLTVDLTVDLCVPCFVFHAQQNGDGNCCSFRIIPEERESLRRRSLHICCRFFLPVFKFGVSASVWDRDREVISGNFG